MDHPATEHVLGTEDGVMTCTVHELHPGREGPGCNYNHSQFVVDCQTICRVFGERKQFGFFTITEYQDDLVRIVTPGIRVMTPGDINTVELYVKGYEKFDGKFEDVPAHARRHILDLIVKIEDTQPEWKWKYRRSF